jgi:hypothetical protein
MKGQGSQQEEIYGAITLIILGLILLFEGPGRLTMWLIPGAEEAPSFHTAGRTLMIGGGASFVVGAAMAWHVWWTRPK